MNFDLVFQLLGLGIVLGIANLILKQVGREDIAFIANMLAIVIAIGLIVKPIVSIFREALSVFDMVR